MKKDKASNIKAPHIANKYHIALTLPFCVNDL